MDLFALLQPDTDSRSCAWCVWPLHMHRQIIMSHNIVTGIKNKLTCSTFGKQIAFQWDMTSKIPICLTILPMTQEPLPWHCLNLISIWWLAGEDFCGGESLQVQQALHSEWVMNWVQWRAQGQEYLCLMAASQNLARYDYFPVEKSVAAFETSWGQCQDTP